MGIDARIVVYTSDLSHAEGACSAAFERIAALDTMMSDYRKDSELTRLSESSGGPPKHVSPEMMIVLKQANEISRLSNGLFDVTVGPLVKLWRAARKTAIPPSAKQISDARKLVGYQNVILDLKAGTVRLKRLGMQLDFGAIAKGYAADEAQRVLKLHGVKQALVEMGGDIVVTDPPPGTRGWKIEVPNDIEPGSKSAQFFSNCAVSSSGDTEQFVVIGGKKYSHVVNPRTGLALSQGVQTTVIAKNGITSDSISTAVTLVDPNRRALLLRAYPGTKAYVRVIPFSTNTRD